MPEQSTIEPPPAVSETTKNPKFERALYESVLVAYGRVLAKYNAFAQGSILRDVGREMIEYLGRHGFPLEQEGNMADLDRLTELFVENGFTEKLEVEPAEVGRNYTWHNLYGRDAYEELHEITDNPFLACPLNLGLFYLAQKHGKALKLLRKRFDDKSDVVEAQYDIVDASPISSEDLEPLVIENARLYQIAQERLDKLERAQAEIRTLRGIVPVCACCHKVRDENHEWHSLESYLQDHSEADISHSYCPTCEARALTELDAI